MTDARTLLPRAAVVGGTPRRTHRLRGPRARRETDGSGTIARAVRSFEAMLREQSGVAVNIAPHLAIPYSARPFVSETYNVAVSSTTEQIMVAGKIEQNDLVSDGSICVLAAVRVIAVLDATSTPATDPAASLTWTLYRTSRRTTRGDPPEGTPIRGFLRRIAGTGDFDPSLAFANITPAGVVFKTPAYPAILNPGDGWAIGARLVPATTNLLRLSAQVEGWVFDTRESSEGRAGAMTD